MHQRARKAGGWWRPLLACILGTILCQDYTGWAQTRQPSKMNEQLSSSLVGVRARRADTTIVQGNGVVIQPHQVVTSCGLIPQDAVLEVRSGSRSMGATLLLADSDRELCLLAVPELSVLPLQWGTGGSKLMQQASVWAAGADAANGFATVESAIVLQLRGQRGPLIETTLVGTDPMLGRGVFDQQGQLVGITTVFVQGKERLYFTAPTLWLNSLHAGEGQDEFSRNLYWLKRAALAEKNTDWNALRELSQSWATELPESATAWHSLGYASINLEAPQEALQAFEETVRINPDDIDGWSNIGFAQSDLMHFSEAARAYEQVVRLRPDDVEGWLSLSLASDAAGEHARSRRASEQLMRLDPVKAQELRSYFDQGGSLRFQDHDEHTH